MKISDIMNVKRTIFVFITCLLALVFSGCGHQVRLYRTREQVKEFSEYFSIQRIGDDLVIISKNPRLYSQDIERLFGHPPSSIEKNEEIGESTWFVAFENVNDPAWAIKFRFVYNNEDLLYKIVIPKEYHAVLPVMAMENILNNYINCEKHYADFATPFCSAGSVLKLNPKKLLGPVDTDSENNNVHTVTYRFRRVRQLADVSDAPICEVSYLINSQKKISSIKSDFEGIAFDISLKADAQL